MMFLYYFDCHSDHAVVAVRTTTLQCAPLSQEEHERYRSAPYA